MKRKPATKKQARASRREEKAASPRDPVATVLSHCWDRLFALYLHKLGEDEIVLTMEDIRAYQRECPGEMALTAEEKPDGLHITLMQRQDANDLVRQRITEQPS